MSVAQFLAAATVGLFVFDSDCFFLFSVNFSQWCSQHGVRNTYIPAGDFVAIAGEDKWMHAFMNLSATFNMKVSEGIKMKDGGDKNRAEEESERTNSHFDTK